MQASAEGTKRMELDSTDRQILMELKKDCRRSARELARVVGVSPATIIERMRKLERNGYIIGYSANIDFLKLGYEFMGIVKITIRGNLLETEERISKMPGVAAVYDITGDYDAMAIVLCKSRGDLSRLVKKILSSPNVEKTNTSVVLNVMKDFSRFDEV